MRSLNYLTHLLTSSRILRRQSNISHQLGSSNRSIFSVPFGIFCSNVLKLRNNHHFKGIISLEFSLIPYNELRFSSALIKEAAISSETQVPFYQATRHHITEEENLRSHHLENFKYLTFTQCCSVINRMFISKLSRCVIF